MFQIFPPVFPFSLFCSVHPPSVLLHEASNTSGNLRWVCRFWGSPGEGALIKQGLDPINNQYTVTDFQKKKKKTEKVLHKFWTVWCFGECVFSDVFIGLLCMYTFLREHACFIQTFPSGALVMSKQTKKISKTIMLPKRGLSIDFKLTSFRPKLHPTVIWSWHKKSEMFFLCIYLYQGQIVHRIV